MGFRLFECEVSATGDNARAFWCGRNKEGIAIRPGGGYVYGFDPRIAIDPRIARDPRIAIYLRIALDLRLI